ncbi:PTPA-CTERM sorting domain-containing protein [Synechocystis sp. LKSZ1]|uniref:PTPA-CTERM sorting domain-containing protein n=1 Tax=Synechocystis sp. LKSZ1 TaxID=3144951 RepID=UPI00336C1A76
MALLAEPTPAFLLPVLSGLGGGIVAIQGNRPLQPRETQLPQGVSGRGAITGQN